MTGARLSLSRRWQSLRDKGAGEVILTPRLLLRPPCLSDAADFFECVGDERVARYVLWHKHHAVGEARETLRAIRRRSREQGGHTFAICEKGSGRVIGTIGPVWLDWGNRSCEVGFSLAHRAWGQGLMTEALGAFLRYAFSELGLNRVEGQHDMRNPASGRVMEKAGMALEGRLRQRLYYKGAYADVALYAATRDAWRGDR